MNLCAWLTHSAHRDGSTRERDVSARRRGRGPAAEARSKARLLAFNESKRQRVLADSKLRGKLNLVLKRMRYERMHVCGV